MRLLFIIFALHIFILYGCQNKREVGNSDKNRELAIDGVTAIKYAEEFVKAQGYTKLPLKKSQFKEIKLEEGEYASDTMQILKFRYNMLEPEGFAAKQHGNSWSVGFEYASKENNIGRAVTMDTMAKNIIMQPGEVRIDWFYETK